MIDLNAARDMLKRRLECERGILPADVYQQGRRAVMAIETLDQRGARKSLILKRAAILDIDEFELISNYSKGASDEHRAF